jgi:hypothetical protein
MKLNDFLKHPLSHDGVSNVSEDQHHEQPENIEVSNTTLSVSPLPGGPGQWDITVPYEANVVMFSFRGIKTVAEGGGKSGIIGIATRSSLEASTVSLGGHGTISSGAYNASYSKKAAALYLSHKCFDSTGGNLALTDASLVATSGSTRVLRTTWTNFAASYKTLNVWGEVQVIG